MALEFIQRTPQLIPFSFHKIEEYNRQRLTPSALQVGLLITEAVFSVSGEAYLGSKVSRLNRVTMHWVAHTAGLSLVLVGLIIIVVNKVEIGRAHV